jgi:hypothetical protein
MVHKISPTKIFPFSFSFIILMFCVFSRLIRISSSSRNFCIALLSSSSSVFVIFFVCLDSTRLFFSATPQHEIPEWNEKSENFHNNSVKYFFILFIFWIFHERYSASIFLRVDVDNNQNIKAKLKEEKWMRMKGYKIKLNLLFLF